MLISETINSLTTTIGEFAKEGRRIYATSSFQTQSVPLLHLLSIHCPEVQIIFLDTGFLFAETYSFKEELKEKFNLNIVELKSGTSPHLQVNEDGLFHYSSDTNFCCYLNKVLPLELFLKKGDVWISGVRRDQSSLRKTMPVIEENKRGNIRFHPMLEWTSKDVWNYINENNLPKHPLESEGYISVGCVPCTHKWTGESMRGGRWVGQQKTECGLHTEDNRK